MASATHKTRSIGTACFKTGLALALISGLSACGSGGILGFGGDREPDLINIDRGRTGPDEFGFVPNKPIELPEDLAALPLPKPGQGNRVDPTPKEDAVAALGGNPALVRDSGAVPTRDGGLVTAASRYGVAPGIREQLAAEDLEYRRSNDGRLLERLFNLTVYYQAYEPLSLDKYAELERFRRSGIRTVAAPPNPAED